MGTCLSSTANRIICLVIPSLQPGGMERVMSELAKYFCYKTDNQVHLILYGKIPEVFYLVPSQVHLHKPLALFNSRFRLFSTIGRLYFLRNAVRRIKPESILSFGEYWNSFVLLALLGLSYPIFVSDRCSPIKRFSKFHTFLRNCLYPRARGIIAQTERTKQIYYSYFKHEKIVVIGNPIAQFKRNQDYNKENYVLTIGRLINSKHHDRLIKIFSQVSAPSWKLIIVGDDAQKQSNMLRLKKLIQSLNMEDRIFLAGSQKEVDIFYFKSKIFAFTSSSEGFPNVIGEAMAAGLPVISYDCITGPSELITDGENGFLVPVYDDVSFRDKLQLLIINEDLRISMSEKAMESVKKFELGIIGQKYLDFIL